MVLNQHPPSPCHCWCQVYLSLQLKEGGYINCFVVYEHLKNNDLVSMGFGDWSMVRKVYRTFLLLHNLCKKDICFLTLWNNMHIENCSQRNSSVPWCLFHPLLWPSPFGQCWNLLFLGDGFRTKAMSSSSWVVMIFFICPAGNDCYYFTCCFCSSAALLFVPKVP